MDYFITVHKEKQSGILSHPIVRRE